MATAYFTITIPWPFQWVLLFPLFFKFHLFNLRYTFDLGVATVIVKILAVGFFGLAYYFSERSPIPDENVDLDVIH